MTRAQCDVVDVQVGRRVRMTRIFRDRSILEAARHLGVSVAEYVDLEDGKRRFDARQLSELSGLLKVNVVLFFGKSARFNLKKYHKPSPMTYYTSNDNRTHRSVPSE